MWKPNQTTSQPTQSDAAPKSAPHPQNGRATAPPRSPCLDIWNKTLGSLGRQFTQATFFTHFQKAEFRGVNGKEFVVAVAPGSVDWLNNRLNDTIHRTLRYEGQDPELTITFIPLEVKGVVFDGKGFVAR